MTRSAEAHGTTVDEAVRRALQELSLTEEEATVEVLDRGRRGLFGGGRSAHVRVTARDIDSEQHPLQAAAQIADGDDASNEEDGVADHNTDTTTQGTDADTAPDAGAALDTAGDAAAQSPDNELTTQERMDQLDEEAELAADFIEGLLDRFDLPGDLEIEIHEDQAFVNLQDVDSGILIGRRGATLEALQELVRSAVQRQTERRAHVRIDVEGYKARQTEKLRDKCREAIAQVRETGEPYRLEPMDSYERKLMHGLVAKTGGVTSASEGHESKRRVVIHPAD